MAGEKARKAAEQLKIKADELMTKISEKEQLVARLRNEVGEEKREAARETVALSNPGNDTMDAVSLAESQAEISNHSSRISKLDSEIAELKRQSDKYNSDSLTLTNLAESAEAAEGQANDAADRALAEI